MINKMKTLFLALCLGALVVQCPAQTPPSLAEVVILRDKITALAISNEQLQAKCDALTAKGMAVLTSTNAPVSTLPADGVTVKSWTDWFRAFFGLLGLDEKSIIAIGAIGHLLCRLVIERGWLVITPASPWYLQWIAAWAIKNPNRPNFAPVSVPPNPRPNPTAP
jgi:hypothetical protein